jgi:epoxyqueuosine reductase
VKKILLHHCCAPCSPGPVEFLKEEFSITSLWYNPNIYPGAEHANRKASLVDYVGSLGFELITGPEVPEDPKGKCETCYMNRMAFAAGLAKKLGIENFSTTLLASPFQKHELIKGIGLRAAEKEKLNFIYFDVRPEYFKGKNEMRAKGSYMQKYCGCSASLAERALKK